MQSNSEVIVVDDCSTDNSVKIAQKYKVRIIVNKFNMGTLATRKIGIQHT
jgi:glycosyltransferase involved in cell wall biosynthesis